MASFSSAISSLETILTTAAATVSQFTVIGGEPDGPPHRTLAWWYEGSGPNPLIPDTATDAPYAENVTIRAYWSVGTRVNNPNRTLELEVESLARAITSRLELDHDLGGNLSSLVIGDASAGWTQNTLGAWWRLLTIPLSLGFTDLEAVST